MSVLLVSGKVGFSLEDSPSLLRWASTRLSCWDYCLHIVTQASNKFVYIGSPAACHRDTIPVGTTQHLAERRTSGVPKLQSPSREHL